MIWYVLGLDECKYKVEDHYGYVDGDGECDYDDKGEDEKERHKVESGECD